MSRVDEILQDLRTKRDEIEVQLHLASKEAQQEFQELEEKWDQFRSKADLSRTAQDVGSAFEALGDELKKGYERLKRAL